MLVTTVVCLSVARLSQAAPQVVNPIPDANRIAPIPHLTPLDEGLGITRLAVTEGGYSINVAPVGVTPIQPEISLLDGGRTAVTVIGRFYIWWQIHDPEYDVVRKLDLHADHLVIFLVGNEPWFKTLGTSQQVIPSEIVQGIYLGGNVKMAEGSRSIQAEEVYYDLPGQRALAIDASLRTYDVRRKIPVYVYAQRLRQHAQDIFSAEGTVLTTSEFYRPQISLTSDKIIVMKDTTSVDAASGNQTDASFQVEMQDARFKLHDVTLLKLPKVQGDLDHPDAPLKGFSVGQDSLWGTSVETQWDLPKLLGLQGRPGADSTFHLDYYSKRGPGAGFDADYAEDNYFGKSIGYYIYDSGEDHLGRDASRRDLVPPDQNRGRLTLQHRHFLPYHWQVTAELSYLSDENFLEQYYRGEAQAGKEQETLLHSKRIENNWALSLLAKKRINDFADQLEELPSAQFNLAGQSLFDGLMTFYSNSYAGSLRQRYGENTVPGGTVQGYTFLGTRNELDLPLHVPRWQIVPFVAATLAYEDGDEFFADVQGNPIPSQQSVWSGEVGLRLTSQPIWRLFKDVQSRFWDLNEVRHVINPSVLAVAYTQDPEAASQRDLVRLGLSNRWQTKRGVGKKQRTVDWIRLDIDFTWLDNPAETMGNSNELIWNAPQTPLLDRGSYTAPPADRRISNSYGPNRSYAGGNLVWRLTDTTAVLGGAYYDIMGGVVRKADVGVARVCWPDLTTYFGTRYLRDTDNHLGQIGSNMFTFAATYRLDPRYAMVFSNQYDFEYGENIRSDIAFIRKYHRLNYALTLSVDESLDRTSLVFSLWPQGIKELSLGLSRYAELGLD
ncbi:hypothetical protein ACFL6U_08010 [Planctomycetota bacterium]